MPLPKVKHATLSRALYTDQLAEEYAQYSAIINGHIYMYGVLGKTNCCGAATIVGERAFFADDLVPLFIALRKSIFHTFFHCGGGWTNQDVFEKTYIEPINKQYTGVLKLSYTPITPQDQIICLEVLDKQKYMKLVAEVTP